MTTKATLDTAATSIRSSENTKCIPKLMTNDREILQASWHGLWAADLCEMVYFKRCTWETALNRTSTSTQPIVAKWRLQIEIKRLNPLLFVSDVHKKYDFDKTLIFINGIWCKTNPSLKLPISARWSIKLYSLTRDAKLLTTELYTEIGRQWSCTRQW